MVEVGGSSPPVPIVNEHKCKMKNQILWKSEDKFYDLNESALPKDALPVAWDDPVALGFLRHSCSHLLAQAVMELFPDAMYGVGPAIDKGFYYDFLVEKPFSENDLALIAKKMKFLIKKDMEVEHLFWDKAKAIEYFKKNKQFLKIELIEDKVEGDEVSLYRQGDFIDLCRGPHLPSLRFLKHFALLSVASAYWKGDENGQSMQRIYGTVFPTAEALKEYMDFLKEAKKRDHRKIGKELNLFSIDGDDVGPGLVLWHPKGSIIRHEIESYWKEEHLKSGYDFIYSPHVAKFNLWEISGHSAFYEKNMFKPMSLDKSLYQLKPMNCPFHIAVYKERAKSYRELPLRWAELGTVYRYEKSGVLHGLLRVRGFTQDDAHIFCTPEQMQDEVKELISFSLMMLNKFGFHDFDVYLSTKPDKYVGDDKDWDRATSALEDGLKDKGVEYQIDPGEGVFYGPKIDIKVRDSLGRSWQCTTIQVDFNLPKRFELEYNDSTGQTSRPIMIHRALLGSIERFFGVLTEHHAGFFPTWLSPVHVVVIAISERHHEFAKNISKLFRAEGLRVIEDFRSEGMRRKIRDAEVQKIPYMVIIGDKEVENSEISYRVHKQGDCGSLSPDKFIEGIKLIIKEKKETYGI